MNTVEGMSDEELDVWADIFVQAKIGQVTEVTFSQFVSNPFLHLGPSSHGLDRPQNKKQHLRLVHSNDAAKNRDPQMVPNSPLNRLNSRNDEEAT